MTQHKNTPQVKVTPQDSNYSHLNKPGTHLEGDSHYLPLNHDKGGSGARNKDKLTSVPQVGSRTGDNIQKRGVPGGEEYDVINNKVLIHRFRFEFDHGKQQVVLEWAIPPPYFLVDVCCWSYSTFWRINMQSSWWLLRNITSDK